MSYHGNVKVDGPADVRELPDLTIAKVAVGPMDNNAYVLQCRATGEKLLIDAAAEPETLLALIDGPLAAIVTTHQHGDHWQALSAVAAATDAVTYAGEHDVDGIPTPTQVPVADGDVVKVGQVELRAIHLVGHTPGSIALVYDDPQGHPHLFTGDCLFPGGVGSTNGDPERFATLYRDVADKLFGQLPDETWIYPGHGNDSTLGAERPHLEEWRERGW